MYTPWWCLRRDMMDLFSAFHTAWGLLPELADAGTGVSVFTGLPVSRATHERLPTILAAAYAGTLRTTAAGGASRAPTSNERSNEECQSCSHTLHEQVACTARGPASVHSLLSTSVVAKHAECRRHLGHSGRGMCGTLSRHQDQCGLGNAGLPWTLAS